MPLGECRFKPFVVSLLVSLVGKPIQLRKSDYLVAGRVNTERLNNALGRRDRTWFPSSIHFEVSPSIDGLAVGANRLKCIVEAVLVASGNSIEIAFQLWDLDAEPVVDD
jgi:hypothetical protein